MVLVLDWYTKKIVGHYAGIQCKAEHRLEALDCPQDFIGKLERWIEYYNNEYLHFSLKYKTPAQFEQLEIKKILLAAA